MTRYLILVIAWGLLIAGVVFLAEHSARRRASWSYEGDGNTGIYAVSGQIGYVVNGKAVPKDVYDRRHPRSAAP